MRAGSARRSGLHSGRRAFLAGALPALLVRVVLAHVDQQRTVVAADAQLAPAPVGVRSQPLGAQSKPGRPPGERSEKARCASCHGGCEVLGRLHPGECCARSLRRTPQQEPPAQCCMRSRCAYGPALVGQAQLKSCVACSQRRGDRRLGFPERVKLLGRQRQALAPGLQLAVALHARLRVLDAHRAAHIEIMKCMSLGVNATPVAPTVNRGPCTASQP